MNTPAVTNLLGARIRDHEGTEATIMAIGTSTEITGHSTIVGTVTVPLSKTVFVALLLLDNRTFESCNIEGWTLVAV